MSNADTTIEEEVENVEYLDDCVTDEVNDGYAALPQNITADKSTFEDIFYPNAIQCLIALYRDKYEKQMNNPQEVYKIFKGIWDDISNDMKESFFDFDAVQVKQKFTQLRQQYFDVATKRDVERFEYFQPFHEIYHDKNITSILTAKDILKAPKLSRTCRDDVLFGPLPQQEMAPVVADQQKQQQTEEIAHKEHEFMIMMERELQAIDNSNCNKAPANSDTPAIKHERQNAIEVDISTSPASKRIKVERTNSLTQKEQIEKVHPEVRHSNEGDMTLAAYNQAQQQRHDEKMDVLRQTVALQERVMEMQIKLLEQIVNRAK